MTMWTRRALGTAAAAVLSLVARRSQAAADPVHAVFVEQAAAMKRDAVAAGDQPFGAVVVRGREIVGFGPSRVVVRNDATAHAEREAIRDATARLGRADLSDCVMYSTSRPCSDCEQAAAEARLARMYVGPDATDAGVPRRSR
ncbi:nucleoside deaminase [Undibacter mobilis]|nr:nucleoside deaminase [Undibacter mobilis]